MDDSFYIEYFTGIAAALKDVAHVPETNEAFFIIDEQEKISEINEAIRKMKSNRIFLLEWFDDGLTDHNADNNQVLIAGAFAIVERVSNKSSTVDRRSAKSFCRSLCREVAHKLKLDSMNGILTESNIVCFLKSDGFSVGPISDGFYGWRYTFEWRVPEVIKRDPAYWL